MAAINGAGLGESSDPVVETTNNGKNLLDFNLFFPHMIKLMVTIIIIEVKLISGTKHSTNYNHTL